MRQECFKPILFIQLFIIVGYVLKNFKRLHHKCAKMVRFFINKKKFCITYWVEIKMKINWKTKNKLC